MRPLLGLRILAIAGALLVAGCSWLVKTPAPTPGPVSTEALSHKIPSQGEQAIAFVDFNTLRSIPEVNSLRKDFLTSAMPVAGATGEAIFDLIDAAAMRFSPGSFIIVLGGRFQELQGTVMQAALKAAATGQQEYRSATILQFSQGGNRSFQAFVNSQTWVVADSSQHVKDVIDTIRDRSGSAYDDSRLRQALSGVGPGYMVIAYSVSRATNGSAGLQASGLSILDGFVFGAQALSLQESLTSSAKYYAQFESIDNAQAAVEALNNPARQPVLLGYDGPETEKLQVKRNGTVVTASFYLANSQLAKLMGAKPEPQVGDATELHNVQTAMAAMMADNSLNAVEPQSTPALDFSVAPKGQGAKPLYPSYLRSRLTKYTYTWDAQGNVRQGPLPYGTPAPTPTPTATATPRPTATPRQPAPIATATPPFPTATPRQAAPIATATPYRTPTPLPTKAPSPSQTPTLAPTPSLPPTKMTTPTGATTTPTLASTQHKFNVGDRLVWDSAGSYATITDIVIIHGELYYTYTVTKGGQVFGPQSSPVSGMDANYQKIP